MEINKEHLEKKLNHITQQYGKLVSQVNDSIVLTQKLEGAIETIKSLLQDLDKVDIEDNKE